MHVCLYVCMCGSYHFGILPLAILVGIDGVHISLGAGGRVPVGIMLE